VTCQQIAQFLIDYVSCEMPAEDRVAFDAHLRECTQCQRYLDSYRKTIALSKGAMAPEPRVEEMPESLVSAILSACRDRTGAAKS